MKEETRKKRDMLPSPAGAEPDAGSVQDTISSIVYPVMQDFAAKICAKGFEASVELDSGISRLALHTPSEAVLSFGANGGQVEIRLCGLFRGLVEAEAVDSLLVEEHILAFLATVMGENTGLTPK